MLGRLRYVTLRYVTLRYVTLRYVRCCVILPLLIISGRVYFVVSTFVTDGIFSISPSWMTALSLTRFTAHSIYYQLIMHIISIKIIAAIIRRPISFFFYYLVLFVIVMFI